MRFEFMEATIHRNNPLMGHAERTVCYRYAWSLHKARELVIKDAMPYLLTLPSRSEAAAKPGLNYGESGSRRLGAIIASSFTMATSKAVCALKIRRAMFYMFVSRPPTFCHVLDFFLFIVVLCGILRGLVAVFCFSFRPRGRLPLGRRG